MNRTFSSRLDDWVRDAPGTRAVNVVTFIDKLDKEIPGARRHYDYLSEICHPNSPGQYLMFSGLDTSTAVVTLSDAKGFERGVFDHVVGGFLQIGLVERALDDIDKLLPAIVELNVNARKN